MQSSEPEISTPRRVLIIANPVAGRRQPRRLPRILDRLNQFGCAVTVRETARRGDGEAQARQALAENFDVIVAAGGDGTVGEVVNGLAGSRQPFALLPLGTANVLAGEIGLDDAPEAIAETIAHGQAEEVYFGVANGRYFTLMAGVGLDARVVAGVNLWLKRRTGMFAYFIQSLIEICRSGTTQYKVLIGATTYQAASVIVAKSHYYGKRFVCAPDARLQDPSLQVCLLVSPGPWNALRYALAMIGGRLCALPDYYIIPATSLTILGGAEDPVQLDGDADGHLPVSIHVSAQPFRLLMPVRPTLPAVRPSRHLAAPGR